MNIRIITVLSLFISLSAESKSLDVKKLKENVKASESNFEEFKKASEVAKDNVSTYKELSEELRLIKSKVTENSRTVTKSQKHLDEHYKKMDQFIENEKQQVEEEKKYIKKLNLLIVEAENRQKKRNENISLYEGKKKEILQEKKNWQEQGDNVDRIIAVIDQKAKQAKKLQEKWSGHLSQTSSDRKKWKKQAEESREVYKKVKSFEQQ